MKLKKHFKEMLITLLVISLTTTGYAIVATVTDGDSLTTTIWNEMKDIVNSNETKLEGVSNIGGNVGIGTMSPGSKLSIESGNIEIRNNDADGKLRFHDPSNYLWDIGIDRSGDGTFNIASFDAIDSFENTSRMTISQTGNVGIGTTNPTSELHVAENANGRSMIQVVATTENAYLTVGNNDGIATLVKKNDGTLKLNNSASSGDNHLVILKSGNVGIGTTSPTEKLDVAGTIKATAFDIGYEIVTNSLYKASWTSGTSVDAICPTGKKIIGGGCNASRANYDNSNMYKNYPANDTTWRCTNDAESTYDLTLTTYAICANVQ